MALSRRDKTALLRVGLNAVVILGCTASAAIMSLQPKVGAWLVVPFLVQGAWTCVWEWIDRRGDRALTTLMHSLHDRIGAPHGAKLRITLFEPSGRKRALRQVARYCWDGSARTGRTVARWDAGPIGRAMEDQSSILIEDVDATQGGGSGSFEATLRAYGMERREIDGLELKDRKCYCAVSVYDDETKLPVAGILIDAAQPRSVGRDAIGLAQSYAKTIIYVLKGGAR